jgi:hypothetical protein
VTPRTCDATSAALAAFLCSTGSDALPDLFLGLSGAISRLCKRHIRIPAQAHLAPLVADLRAQYPSSPAVRRDLQQKPRHTTHGKGRIVPVSRVFEPLQLDRR